MNINNKCYILGDLRQKSPRGVLESWSKKGLRVREVESSIRHRETEGSQVV